MRSMGKCDVISRGSWPWRLRQSGADPQAERMRKYHFRGPAALDESLWMQILSVKIKEGRLTQEKVDIYE